MDILSIAGHSAVLYFRLLNTPHLPRGACSVRMREKSDLMKRNPDLVPGLVSESAQSREFV